MDTWLVVMILGEMVFVAFVLWIVAYYLTRKSKERSEERLRILERFGSSQELADFLGSEAGDKLLRNFVPRSANPRSGIFAGLTAGLVCVFAGVGFLILAWLRVFDDPDVFLIPGVLGCLAGTGILVATAISLRLLRNWREQPPLPDFTP